MFFGDCNRHCHVQKQVMEFTDKKRRKRVKGERNSKIEKAGYWQFQDRVGDRTSWASTDFVPSKKVQRKEDGSDI